MSARKDRTGETSVAKNGMKMTITAYRRYYDIDVQLDDGAVRKGVTYQCFIKGEIRHPKEQERLANLSESRIGETSIASNGMKMTVVAYRGCYDIDVQFEDGAIKKGVKYSDFKRGIIRHPDAWEKLFLNKRIGETSVASNGMKMTITAYRRYNDIDVQFEDGAIREHINYKEFKNGSTQHPNDLNRVGKTFIASNGMILTVIAYRNRKDVDVQFEDGFIKYGIDYERLKNGGVKNPHFPMVGKGTYNTFQTQYAYTAPDGSVYFYCECQKCGLKVNLTARELINLNHTCENIVGSEK